jgi:hypothetical protein
MEGLALAATHVEYTLYIWGRHLEEDSGMFKSGSGEIQREIWGWLIRLIVGRRLRSAKIGGVNGLTPQDLGLHLT